MFDAAPPLSVEQVLTVLEGLAGKWEEVGEELLVPETTMRAIASENSDNVARLRGIIIYWILRDPDASWRRLILRLDWSVDEDIRQTADTIRHYAEKLSGQYTRLSVVV